MFITIVGIDVKVRSESWVADANGFWLPMQVDSWLWVGSATSFVGLGCRSSGFWLCFLGLSCYVFWVWLMGFQCFVCFLDFNGFCGGLLITVAMVVVLFLVFCFAMDCGCHGGGGGGGGSSDSVVVVIYCFRYIILLCCLYYFNV